MDWTITRDNDSRMIPCEHGQLKLESVANVTTIDFNVWVPEASFLGDEITRFTVEASYNGVSIIKVPRLYCSSFTPSFTLNGSADITLSNCLNYANSFIYTLNSKRPRFSDFADLAENFCLPATTERPDTSRVADTKIIELTSDREALAQLKTILDSRNLYYYHGIDAPYIDSVYTYDLQLPVEDVVSITYNSSEAHVFGRAVAGYTIKNDKDEDETLTLVTVVDPNNPTTSELGTFDTIEEAQTAIDNFNEREQGFSNAVTIQCLPTPLVFPATVYLNEIHGSRIVKTITIEDTITIVTGKGQKL